MSIRPKVKAIYTVEMNQLESFRPANPRIFSIHVRAMVGPADGDGEEPFDIRVCTPEWLMEETEREGFVLGLHRLFIAVYDPVQIRKILTKFMERYSGDSWTEVAEKISRIAYWEFEGYRES